MIIKENPITVVEEVNVVKQFMWFNEKLKDRYVVLYNLKNGKNIKMKVVFVFHDGIILADEDGYHLSVTMDDILEKRFSMEVYHG